MEMYDAQDEMMRSAPCSIGRRRKPEAPRVLSTTRGRPWECARVEKAAMSATVWEDRDMLSRNMALVFESIAELILFE
jgi:hypothetical protein